MKINWPKLQQVEGSEHCLYSILENNQEKLYKNQEKLLQAIQLVYNAVKEKEAK